MKCEICGKGMPEGVTLHRQNETGVKGIWRCTDCNIKPVDPFAALLDMLLKGHEKVVRISRELQKKVQ